MPGISHKMSVACKIKASESEHIPVSQNYDGAMVCSLKTYAVTGTVGNLRISLPAAMIPAASWCPIESFQFEAEFFRYVYRR